MALTYLQIFNQIADEIDFPNVVTNDTNTAISTTTNTQTRRIGNQINRANRHIWNRLNKKNEDAETLYQMNTVAGTESYTMPTGLKIVQMVKIQTTDPPLRILPWTEFEMHYKPGLIIGSGEPGVCAIYGRKLYFYPIPDTVYTLNIHGLSGATNMTLDTDEPGIDEELHDVVFHKALVYAMMYENNPVLAPQIQESEKSVRTTLGRMRRHNQMQPRIMAEEEFYRGRNWRRLY